MSGWALATDAAIWILIVGSVVVFGWFLLEVLRLARRRPPERRHGPGGTGEPAAPAADGPQDSSTRSTSMDER